MREIGDHQTFVANLGDVEGEKSMEDIQNVLDEIDASFLDPDLADEEDFENELQAKLSPARSPHRKSLKPLANTPSQPPIPKPAVKPTVTTPKKKKKATTGGQFQQPGPAEGLSPPQPDGADKELDALLTHGQVSEKYLLAAETYCDPNDTAALLDLLSQSDIQEACRVLGIDKAHVMPRPYSAFEKEPDRPWKVHTQVAKLRYEAFEKRRKHCIGSLLQARRLAVAKIQHDLQTAVENENMLSASLHRTFVKQAEREESFRKARLNFKKLREKQERQLRLNREQLEKQLEEKKAREERIESMKNAKKLAYHEKAKLKALCGQRAVEQRDIQIKKKAMKVRFKSADIEQRLHSDESTANKMKAERLRRQRQVAENRRKVFEEFQQRKEQTFNSKDTVVQEKELLSKKMKEQRDLEMMLAQEQKALDDQERMERVNRIRAASAYRKQERVGRMKAVYNRIDQVKEVRQYLSIRQGDIWKQEHTQMDRWKDKHPSVLDVSPGPGEYEAKTTLDNTGGTFGQHNPKSDIEWQIYRASQIPAPGEYDPQKPLVECVRGGMFPTQVVPSEVEMLMKKAADLPGPGRYDPNVGKQHSRSCTFGTGIQAGAIARIVSDKAYVPGPAEYDPETEMAQKTPPVELRHKYDPKYHQATTTTGSTTDGDDDRS